MENIEKLIHTLDKFLFREELSNPNETRKHYRYSLDKKTKVELKTFDFRDVNTMWYVTVIFDEDILCLSVGNRVFEIKEIESIEEYNDSVSMNLIYVDEGIKNLEINIKH